MEIMEETGEKKAVEGSTPTDPISRGSSFTHQLLTEPYIEQRERWPKAGRYILAQFTQEAILVYQAFKPEIGRYAVEHQHFTGCGDYNPKRMTWIKTNFLWMMFRNGWGRKKNQEMTLGIWLKRSAFDRYLSVGARNDDADKRGSIVRLQWDPDHDPAGRPLKNRRVIQLGIKNVRSFADGDDILRIDDFTPFVSEAASDNPSKLVTPQEVVYIPSDSTIISYLGLSREAREGQKDGVAGGEGDDSPPLRVTLCYKGRRKPVVVRPRVMPQLNLLIQQKLGLKASSVTDSKGKVIQEEELKGLSQDVLLHIS